MKSIITATYFVVTLWLTEMAVGDESVVTTPSGPVRGITTKGFSGKDVDAFYGIPYAQSPVDNLRFGPPVEAEPWTEELDATKPSLPCYQRLPTNMNSFRSKKTSWIPMRPWTEDCLRLHVWVPRPRPKNAAVMVYIHGGGFFAGDPTQIVWSGETLAAEENVIVVSMNYRLSIFGFVYLGIPEAPGNAGLMDQQMALRWVSKNIASFGGDPSEVTILGLSAGGASVGYQVLAPSSRAFFKRAILMSGVPSCPWGILSKDKALERTLALAAEFDCLSQDKKQVLGCLLSIHPEHFVDHTQSFWDLSDDKQFAPIFDGEFLPEDKDEILNGVTEESLSLMVGVAKSEGDMLLKMMYPDLFTEEDGALTPSKFNSGVSRVFGDYGETTLKMLSFLYTNWTHPENPYNLRDGFRNLMSDSQFTCPAQEFTNLLSTTGATIYRYVVSYHRRLMMPLPDWTEASHGSDIPLHLGMATATTLGFSAEESNLSRTVMKWWANFARTGDPNSNDMDATKWPKWTPERQEHMNIDIRTSLGKNFRREECALFKSALATTANPNVRFSFIEV